MRALPLALLIAFPAAAESPPALPEGALSRAVGFVQAIRANGCKMTTEEADTRLVALGFTTEETRQFARMMLDQDAAAVDAEATTLTLSDTLCQGDPARDYVVFNDVLSDDPDPVLSQVKAFGADGIRATVWLNLRDNGCILDVSDPAKAASGLTEMVALAAGFPQDMSDAARNALADLVTGFVAEPGPRFTTETGRIVATDCEP